MSEPHRGSGLSFTVGEDGKIETIRGHRVPDGALAAGVEGLLPESREVTERAHLMVSGLFAFARRSREPDPKAVRLKGE